MISYWQIFRHPIRAIHRLRDLEERVSFATVRLVNDRETLERDDRLHALCERHLDLISEDWRQLTFQSQSVLREEMGLGPKSQAEFHEYEQAVRVGQFTGTFDEYITFKRRDSRGYTPA